MPDNSRLEIVAADLERQIAVMTTEIERAEDQVRQIQARRQPLIEERQGIVDYLEHHPRPAVV